MLHDTEGMKKELSAVNEKARGTIEERHSWRNWLILNVVVEGKKCWEYRLKMPLSWADYKSSSSGT